MRPCEAVVGRHGEDHQPRRNGSNATPRWRSAPTIPTSPRAATPSITAWVSATVSATLTDGFSFWKSQSRSGTTIAAGPVDAPTAASPSTRPPIPTRRLRAAAPPARAFAARSCRGGVQPRSARRACRNGQAAVGRAVFRAPGSAGCSHRRLRDAEPLGGLREAASFDDRAECGELLRIHNESLCAGRDSARRRSSEYAGRGAARALAERYAQLAQDLPARGRDAVLRGLDIVFAGLFLLLSPPLSVLITAILATSGRPIFYRGERVGRAGRTFTMLKFRTLRPGAESRLPGRTRRGARGAHPERRRRPGRWLRATQLDEIPQFWNVLVGDMSFVGPRPIRPASRSCAAAARVLAAAGRPPRPHRLRAGETRLRDVDGREARARPGMDRGPIGAAVPAHDRPDRVRVVRQSFSARRA